MQQIDYLGKRIVRWQRGASTFLAWPEGGARLMNWNLAYGDGHIRDIIYWPDRLATLDDIGSVRGGNPILFPFCGRCYDKGEKFRWRHTDGEQRPMPIHGFARDGAFEVVNLTPSGFTARLEPTEENFKSYPFHYDFTVAYRFEELALYVELSLKNLDTKPIPWSAGHHFYFSLPWVSGTSRSSYVLKVPAKEAYRQAPDGTLSPLPEFSQECSFGDPAFPDCVYTRLRGNEVSVVEATENEKLTIMVGPDKKPPDGTSIVTWTEDDNAPFYCVEPWMGPPNSPEHQLGLHTVKPGKRQSFFVEVRLG